MQLIFQLYGKQANAPNPPLTLVHRYPTRATLPEMSEKDAKQMATILEEQGILSESTQLYIFSQQFNQLISNEEKQYASPVKFEGSVALGESDTSPQAAQSVLSASPATLWVNSFIHR